MEVDCANDTPITNCEPLKLLLQELKQEPCAANYLMPVDWRSLGISNYTAIVKRPMDLGTLEVRTLANTVGNAFVKLVPEFGVIFSRPGSDLVKLHVVQPGRLRDLQASSDHD